MVSHSPSVQQVGQPRIATNAITDATPANSGLAD
jgi:hypothetical protein